jgi:hypothetical protein
MMIRARRASVSSGASPISAAKRSLRFYGPASSCSFTPKQGQYLAFIHASGRPPAEADMQRHFCVTPPSVHQMILTLAREGLIRRQPGVARSIEVLADPEALPPLQPSLLQPVKSSVQRYLLAKRSRPSRDGNGGPPSPATTPKRAMSQTAGSRLLPRPSDWHRQRVSVSTNACPRFEPVPCGTQMAHNQT